MKILKRLACAAVSVAMAASMLTGCESGRYVMSYGDTDVNSGIYIYSIISEMLNQQYNLYIKGSSESVMDQKVDGKNMADYLEDKAMKMTKEYCAVTEKFKELGLELTDDELKSVSDSATDTFNSKKDMYEELGISKESIKLILKETKMKDKIFEYYYGKDGKEAPSDEDIQKYVTDNYLRFKSITISKSTNSDEEIKKKENEENKALAEKYFKQAEGKSFADFDEVISDYNKYVEEKNKQASGDSSSQGDTSSSDQSSSQADSSSSAESASAADSSSSKVGDSDSSSQAESSSQTDSSSQSDSSSQADSSSKADSSSQDESSLKTDGSSQDESSAAEAAKETEASKYPNESMINYAMYDKETLETETGKALIKIHDMSVGKVELFENEDGYYIMIKGDVSERAKGFAEENRDTIVKERYDKTFTETIEKWAEELDIKVDNTSIKKYTAKKLYNKYADYTTKNSKK